MVLDYSMMQWVLSIVLGLSYSRFINTITLLARKRHQIKFDFLLISNLIGMITGLTHLWFRSPGFLNSVEGKYLLYHARVFGVSHLRDCPRVFTAKHYAT